jgi:hypothetical protein
MDVRSAEPSRNMGNSDQDSLNRFVSPQKDDARQCSRIVVCVLRQRPDFLMCRARQDSQIISIRVEIAALKLPESVGQLERTLHSIVDRSKYISRVPDEGQARSELRLLRMGYITATWN